MPLLADVGVFTMNPLIIKLCSLISECSLIFFMFLMTLFLTLIAGAAPCQQSEITSFTNEAGETFS